MANNEFAELLLTDRLGAKVLINAFAIVAVRPHYQGNNSERNGTSVSFAVGMEREGVIVKETVEEIAEKRRVACKPA